MKLIGSNTSPYVRKIRVVMVEKRIECEFVTDNVWSAAPVVAQYNPLVKVPVLLLDDGTPLYDSRVIAEYLDGVTPVSRLIPDGNRDRIVVKRWEALGDGIADAGIAIFLERKRPPTQQSADWITRQLGKIDAAVSTAARDLADRDFCHGLSLSLADISLACALLWLELRLPEIKWRDTHPNLRNWIQKLEMQESFAQTVPIV